jgi:hypothetical protein
MIGQTVSKIGNAAPMRIPKPIDHATPSGWGDDPLSHFQSVGMQNEYASFAHVRPWHDALSDIAADLSKCSDYAIASVVKTGDPSALLLFVTAHNQFLASARPTSSRQCLPDWGQFTLYNHGGQTPKST